MPGDEATDHDRLEQYFDLQLDVGLHHGAQLAVYRDGERVVDLAGGVSGPTNAETTSDTKHVLFSCTKPYAAVCAHRLVERGALEYDEPVRSYWPGFADPGSEKAEVTVRHVLSHQAGLPDIDVDSRPDLWTDWEAVVEEVESAELSFSPGATAAYHSLSFGWFVGELVRRASGTPIGEYARKHVFEPLEMTDTYIGLPDDVADDVATLYGYDSFHRCRVPEMAAEAGANEGSAHLFNEERIHRAVIPAGGGIGTASDMARFYACLANGGEIDGVRILEEETVERATELQVEVDHDDTLGVPRRYALGFERAGLPTDKYGTLSPPRVFGHGGYGSIVGWGDPEENLSMAYVTNGIRDEYEHVTRVSTMADAVRTALGAKR